MKKSLQGFSLLEILVAFSIMGIALGIVLNIFSSGLTTAAISEEYTIATQIAESLMAAEGIEKPLSVGERHGVEADKYRWSVRVDDAASLLNVETVAPLLDVRVTVEWGEQSGRLRTVELSTVKTGAVD